MAPIFLRVQSLLLHPDPHFPRLAVKLALSINMLSYKEQLISATVRRPLFSKGRALLFNLFS
jgi:hypothetical protein